MGVTPNVQLVKISKFGFKYTQIFFRKFPHHRSPFQCNTLKTLNSRSLTTFPPFSAIPPPLIPAKCQEPSGSSPALYQHLLFALKSHARTTAPLSTHLHAHALQVSAVQHVLLPHAVEISSKLTDAHYFPARTQRRSEMFLLLHARVPQGGQG